jgi:hypothetical protein
MVGHRRQALDHHPHPPQAARAAAAVPTPESPCPGAVCFTSLPLAAPATSPTNTRPRQVCRPSADGQNAGLLPVALEPSPRGLAAGRDHRNDCTWQLSFWLPVAWTRRTVTLGLVRLATNRIGREDRPLLSKKQPQFAPERCKYCRPHLCHA